MLAIKYPGSGMDNVEHRRIGVYFSQLCVVNSILLNDAARGANLDVICCYGL